MALRPGQKPGQAKAEAAAPVAYGWREYVAALVQEHGTLTAVAWKLLEHGDGPDDVASVERALRRLRERSQSDGGVWGRRLLRQFGMPRTIEERLRWMGLYHSPFNDLPIALCEDQLRLWDQPPVSTSRARVWLELAAASVALRRRAFDEAQVKLTAAAKTLAAGAADAKSSAAARAEESLVRAYLQSRVGTDAGVLSALSQAEQLLAEGSLTDGDQACFVARLVDQQAFRLNRQGEHAAALALYRALPAADIHPFASYRREAGLAFGALKLGDVESARRHVLAACEFAGDGGYTRLRVMSLIMLARIEKGAAAQATLARAHAIAVRLDDEELLLRVSRARERKE
jgi:hypothetical protein